MGLQGYVGSAEDQARIRKLEREREEESKRLKDARDAKASQPVGFRQWQHGATEVLELALKKETVGLVSRDEFVAKKGNIKAKLEAEALKRKRAEQDAQALAAAAAKAKKEKERRAAKLSFEDDTDEEEGASDPPLKASRLQKNDEVETDFLPDTDRERAMSALRDNLKQEWLVEQEALRARTLHVKYSYWDGAGHQRDLEITVGASLEDFLKQAKNELEADFPQLRHVSVANLMLVKNDVILPQSMTFYSIIAGQVHDRKQETLFDVDQPLDGQTAHACKVVQRHWYENNKHIYPANRWEFFDDDVHVKK